MQDLTQFKLKPIAERKARGLIDACATEKIYIALTEGTRSFQRQQALYNQGRTTPGMIVTNAKPGQSLHNYGVAFDIIFIVNGRRTYTGNWKRVGEIARSLGLEWGGDWKGFVDRPHFQYTAGYTLKDFINKKVDESKFA